MRWLLLPFRLCLYGLPFALFGSLRWLTRDYDRFVRLGSKLFVLCFVLWLTAAMSGHRLTIYFPPEIPFWWWVIGLMCFWCGTGWLLSSRPVQWAFGGIADYCKAAILPPAPQPKPKPAKAAPKPAPPKEHIAGIASKNVAVSGDASAHQSVLQLSPELINLMTQPQDPPHP